MEDERTIGWRRFSLLKTAQSIEELDNLIAVYEKEGFEQEWMKRMIYDTYNDRKNILINTTTHTPTATATTNTNIEAEHL